MATKSNSSPYSIMFSTMLMLTQRKMHRAFDRFFWNWLHLEKGSCCLQFCDASLCLFLPPSFSVASSNQDIMRAKRGCISTLRPAGFSEHWQDETARAGGQRWTENWFCVWLEKRHPHWACAAAPCLSVPPHTEAALYASQTHRRDLLCLHISHHLSLPPPSLPSFSPMPAPIQKLGTPWEQLQRGFQCSGIRDTPPALQPCEQPLTIVCARLHVCDVCVTFPLAPDCLFIKPMNTGWIKKNLPSNAVTCKFIGWYVASDSWLKTACVG